MKGVWDLKVGYRPLWKPFTSHAEVLFFESVLVPSWNSSSEYKISVSPPSNLYSCAHWKVQKYLKSKQKKEQRKKKNQVFNEGSCFSHIKVYQLQSTAIINYPEAVNKDIICKM